MLKYQVPLDYQQGQPHIPRGPVHNQPSILPARLRFSSLASAGGTSFNCAGSCDNSLFGWSLSRLSLPLLRQKVRTKKHLAKGGYIYILLRLGRLVCERSQQVTGIWDFEMACERSHRNGGDSGWWQGPDGV